MSKPFAERLSRYRSFPARSRAGFPFYNDATLALSIGCVMRLTIASLLALLIMAPAWAQNDGEAAAATGRATDADDFDRNPVKCITANRIDRTKVIDNRTIVFYMRGRAIYRNRLAIDCNSLVREKRFSYDLHTNRLCDSDHITVLEYWGSTLTPGISCGLGPFYPITEEEADFLSIEPEEMLENAAAVEETAQSSGEAEPAAPAAQPYDPSLYNTVDSEYREDE